MQTEARAASIRASVRNWHQQGHSVAFVPTMGNLHAGHYSLLELARSRCDHVVASVFVNPTQFGPEEDFARYPRSMDADRVGLAEHGCDLLFAPEVDTLYPHGVEASVRVHLPGLTEILEGAHRPGHFDGVTTVVCKLLSMVQPDVAVFGRKDYQQWRVVERMCVDLGLPVTILAAPIVRDPDGLALSSRNQYLDAAQREVAPRLQQSLQQAAVLIGQGHDLAAIEQATATRLQHAGFAVDYVAIRNAGDLAVPDAGQRTGLVILAAAHLGKTRLIDNLEIA
ncbi:MAG: pantoate--beta-alanine ligase [Rhodanobacteraceae bacterium]